MTTSLNCKPDALDSPHGPLFLLRFFILVFATGLILTLIITGTRRLDTPY